jgi:nucleotidyltransferase/DNA polymerase involved in DNA repair
MHRSVLSSILPPSALLSKASSHPHSGAARCGGGAGADRATILALSAEAKAAGITRGMPVAKAKLCPDLILRAQISALCPGSRALFEILHRYAPVIEPKGYGHAYLDMTGTSRLFGPAVDVRGGSSGNRTRASDWISRSAQRLTNW